jgi:hypothetical protein
VLGPVRLAEEDRLVRVESQGQQVGRHLVRVAPDDLAIVGRGQRVVVDDAVDRVAALLQRDVVAEGAQVVAQVRQPARRLDARERRDQLVRRRRRGRQIARAGRGGRRLVAHLRGRRGPGAGGDGDDQGRGEGETEGGQLRSLLDKSNGSSAGGAHRWTKMAPVICGAAWPGTLHWKAWMPGSSKLSVIVLVSFGGTIA